MSQLELWLRYFMVWPGHPGDREISQGDVLIALAFGRNSWSDEEVQLTCDYRDTYPSDSPLERIRVRGFSPGQPNRELAQAAQQVVDRYEIPALVQWEIGAALDPSWLASPRRHIACLWPDKVKSYFSTEDVLSQAYQLCQQHGLRRPIILAHQRQVVRVALMTRTIFGRTPLVVSTAVSSFDHNSTQLWTTAPIVWRRRELVARAYCLAQRLV